MKVFDTRIEEFPFQASIVKSDDGVTVLFTNEALEQSFGIKLDESTLQNLMTVSTKEFCDSMNLWIFVKEDGVELVNKYEDTYFTKADGFVYSRAIRANQTVGGQIYIPFKNSTVDEWSVRLNSNAPIMVDGEFDVSEDVLSPTLDTFHDVVRQTLPSLNVVSVTPNSDGSNKVLVQVTLNGQAVPRSGVKVYAKSATGYIANRELASDEDGQCEFLARRLDLKSGDEMIAEFGFKFKTNVARVEITQ
jgi:hypothetical protein